MAVDIFAVGETGCSCTCSSSVTCGTIEVIGCGSLGVPNATVSIYTSSGGSLLASGTTNSSGIVSLTWSGSCTVWVTASEATGRLTSYAATRTLGSGTNVITLSNADNSLYACMNCCAIPLKRILTFTSALFGSWTGNWIDQITSGWTPAPVHCPSCSVDAVGVPGFVSNPFPCLVMTCWAFNPSTGCPANTGTTCQCIYWSATSMTCPPSFSWTGTATVTSAYGCMKCIIGPVPPTWTDSLTVSE